MFNSFQMVRNMTGLHGVISSMKNLTLSMAQFISSVGESAMKLITITLLIYVVLQTLEFPL